MPVTDPIGDMLTVVRNGAMVHKDSVEVKRSKMNESICEILKREGFISNYKTMENRQQGLIKVYLKYDKNKVCGLKDLRRISKPGRRVYVKTEEIRSVYGGIGASLISTSHGVMTGKEAKEKNVGGEVLCQVW
jgi:small subunit ribosomal protein S8